MTRPILRKPVIVAARDGLTVTRQQAEFGAVYHIRRGDAPALFSTNRQAEALAWFEGYRAGAQANQPTGPLVN